MTGQITYRIPDGAEIVSESGSTVAFRVTISGDDAGYFERQCPSCKRPACLESPALPGTIFSTCDTGSL
jgi:hypothetical protein